MKDAQVLAPPVPAPCVLVVEDDARIADLLTNYLQAQGFATQWCPDGAQALAQIRTQAPALVLLDLMLPGLDGLGVCTAVRAFSSVPIIMLTARVDEIDRLLGLDTGADDYICKPFSPREVVARIRALLRRSSGAMAAAAVPPGLSIDEPRQLISWQGQALPLTPVEFRLLRLLVRRSGQVLGRLALLEGLHDDFRDVSDRAIDSHIKNLRRKLKQAGVPEGISSVYGVGYRLEAEHWAPQSR
jgi:two-component system response regulator BaeR